MDGGMKMTAIERMIWEMERWAAFIAAGGDPTIAATEWFE
jgi:hypothetical protein